MNKMRKHFGSGVFDVPPRVATEPMDRPYEVIYATRTRQGWTLDGATFCKKPELIARAYYKSQGHSCEYGENATVSILMTALADRLAPSKKKLARDLGLSSSTGWTKLEELGLRDLALNALIRNDPATVVQAISDATERDLRVGLKTNRDYCRALKTEIPYEMIPDDHLIDIWKLLGRDTISQLAKHHVDRTAYRGWPDLTLIRDKTVWFMEVKTTDHFHQSQIELWRRVAKPLGLIFGVVRVKKR